MLKSRGSLPWTVQRYPKAKITQIVFQKCKWLSKKCKSNRPSASLRLKQETNGRPGASERGKAAMEMCAICRGKLGLGIRFRNIYMEWPLVGSCLLLFGSLQGHL
jgi:hypothetical protein